MISDRRRDQYAGALAMAIGIGTAAIGQSYQIGTLTRTGPGFFPVILGVLLALVGGAIALIATVSSASREPISNVSPPAKVKADWRGWGFIAASVIVFIVLASYAGFLAATFMCVFIACFGDRTATWKGSLLLAAGVTAFGAGLFSYVLKVQIPLLPGY